jgi:hypothetical protein
MIVAYVVGFEDERTEIVFGPQDYKTFLSLSPAVNVPPSGRKRISAFLLIYVPWILIYGAFIIIGIPKNAFSINISFEKNLPVSEISEVFYLFTCLFAILIPFVIKTRE